ncbi:MAG TPA: tetratricopeptide repeat protein [Xanthomonadaceae bacterium]
MDYDKLDNEELLRLALDAIRGDRDADAVVMLKTLLEREPGHVYAHYLLAAQHAQLGMMAQAEAGFRAVVAMAPEFAVARFQLAQLLLVTGRAGEARQCFATLLGHPDAMGAFARALMAAAVDDRDGSIRELQAGLALPQPIPALAADMKRLLAQWQQAETVTERTGPSPAAAPMLLANYGRGG